MLRKQKDLSPVGRLNDIYRGTIGSGCVRFVSVIPSRPRVKFQSENDVVEVNV